MWIWWTTASAADTFESSALLAMGGVGAAAAEENAALTRNPGLLALTQRYDFQGQFRYGPYGALSGGLSAVDARGSDVLAGGAAYTGDTAEPPLTEEELPGWVIPGVEIPNKKTSHDVAIGLATPFADRRLSAGLGVVGGYFKNDRQGDGWRFDANAGFGARPVDELTLGLAARNFLPVGPEDRPPELVAGIRTDVGSVGLEANATWLPTSSESLPLNLAAGGEAAVAKVLALRAGWRRDAVGGVHSVAFGFGLLGPGSALEYGTSVPVTGGLSLARTVHQLTLRFSAPDPIPVPD